MLLQCRLGVLPRLRCIEVLLHRGMRSQWSLAVVPAAWSTDVACGTPVHLARGSDSAEVSPALPHCIGLKIVEMLCDTMWGGVLAVG